MKYPSLSDAEREDLLGNLNHFATVFDNAKLEMTAQIVRDLIDEIDPPMTAERKLELIAPSIEAIDKNMPIASLNRILDMWETLK